MARKQLIRFRRSTEAQRSSMSSDDLKPGEPLFVTDTGSTYIGDAAGTPGGVAAGGGGGTAGADGAQGIQGIQGIQGETGPAGADGGGGAYASFYLTTGGVTAISSVQKILVINNTRVNSDTGTFTLATNRVTVLAAGDYKFSVDAYINNSSTSRTEYSCYLLKNGTEITGSRFANYQRGYDSGMSCSYNEIHTVAANDYFEVGIIRTDGGSTAGYQDDNGTRFVIEEK